MRFAPNLQPPIEPKLIIRTSKWYWFQSLGAGHDLSLSLSLSLSERKLENLKNMQRLAWQLCNQMWSLGPSLGLSPNMKYMADTLQHLGVMPNTNIEVVIYFKRDRVSTTSSGPQGLHLLPWISPCCRSHMFKCNIILFFGISPCGWQKIKKNSKEFVWWSLLVGAFSK